MYVVDRIEDNIVVLEDREHEIILQVERNYFPPDIEEGSVLNYVNGEYVFDYDLEEELRRRVQEKFDKLINKDNM